MKFFPADWIQDTRHLSLPAKGAWIDLINMMWLNTENRGEYSAARPAFARSLGASEVELEAILPELETVAAVTVCNGVVTVMSRRIKREETSRKFARNRQATKRSHAPVTPASRQSHAQDVQTFRRLDVQTKTLTPCAVPKTGPSAPPASKPPKPKGKVREFWKPLIEHINTTWSRKKGGAPYLWAGKDFMHLARAYNRFEPWGVMALWDVYINSGDEWAAKNGYSVPEFVRQIPRLVDSMTWKERSVSYQNKLMPINPEGMAKVQGLVAGLAKSMPGRA